MKHFTCYIIALMVAAVSAKASTTYLPGNLTVSVTMASGTTSSAKLVTKSYNNASLVKVLIADGFLTGSPSDFIIGIEPLTYNIVVTNKTGTSKYGFVFPQSGIGSITNGAGTITDTLWSTQVYAPTGPSQTSELLSGYLDWTATTNSTGDLIGETATGYAADTALSVKVTFASHGKPVVVP